MPAPKPYLCKYCGETEPSKFFQKNKMKSCCLKCHTLWVHQKQRELKIKAVEYMGGKCCKCGYIGVAAVFDFHHINPAEKEFNWGSRRTPNWNTLKLELDKCMLLCSNCHREIHDEEWFNNLPSYHPERIRRKVG